MSYPGEFSTPPSGGSASSNQNSSRYPQLESVLRTEEGFKSSIRYTGGADAALGVVLTLALVGVVYNLVTTIRSLSANKLPFGEYFFEMFFETRGTGGSVDPTLWAMVWLPVIAVPIALILLLVSKSTRGGAVTKVFDQFRQAGFVAELMPTGIPIQMGNQKGMVFLIAGPGVPEDWATAAIQQLRVKANADPKSRETKDFKKQLTSTASVGAAGQAALASQADPTLPDGIYITGQQNNQQPVRIAVPVGNDNKRIKLWPLQKTVALA